MICVCVCVCVYLKGYFSQNTSLNLNLLRSTYENAAYSRLLLRFVACFFVLFNLYRLALLWCHLILRFR